MNGARHDAAQEDAQQKKERQEKATYRDTIPTATVTVICHSKKAGRHCVLRGSYSADMYRFTSLRGTAV
jgi:hypothetical protein